jgi:hypothetical protein
MAKSRALQEKFMTYLGQKRYKKQLRRNNKTHEPGKSYGTVKKSTPGQPQHPYTTSLNHIVSSVKKMGYYEYPKWQQSVNLSVPSYFSISERPSETYDFIIQLISILHNQSTAILHIDYAECKKIDIDAQIFLDIILKDFISFFHSSKARNQRVKLLEINAINIDNVDVRKILFSIGSNKILRNKEIYFPDILPYHLCVGNKEKKGDPIDIASQKEVDITNLVDYILACLKKFDRELTPEAKSDLCQVIGEILINAEEHSTLKYRYSIGYYQDKNEDGRHYGTINLVILNFGQTIFEKFKDPLCPTQHIVKRMNELSESYTKRKFFIFKQFEEETLWSLYALQEGVTTKANYRKRGNGSIRFIESFFNLRGNNCVNDDVSRLTILSGNSKITVDGSYLTTEKVSGSNNFKVITFNKSGNIEDAPDKKFVTFVDNYFPGTMIFAKILVQDDDVQIIKTTENV